MVSSGVLVTGPFYYATCSSRRNKSSADIWTRSPRTSCLCKRKEWTCLNRLGTAPRRHPHRVSSLRKLATPELATRDLALAKVLGEACTPKVVMGGELQLGELEETDPVQGPSAL